MLTYNNKDIHSRINQTPNEARKQEHEFISRLNVSIKAKRNALYPELSVGDRIENKRTTTITEKKS